MTKMNNVLEKAGDGCRGDEYDAPPALDARPSLREVAADDEIRVYDSPTGKLT
ncbi:hypothetical protein [Streptomyces sudanensis]|uniref:hypothetical protein n=1 Tax=Streptomyces sudanensis TaxID=436397 RepID=UPI0020CCD33A|nr:hypothetical protein [Streptomyces sudanensis]MCP9957547.1 hypothetical protein [Streptomyces sudanensis]MCP9986680.1 hypothetical protein [Streptomyces sudanensis]MCQ0001910.1 hypothetical protein [Streptomyces sudanensis]